MKHGTEPVIDDAALAVLLSALADMPVPESPIPPLRLAPARIRIHMNWQAPPLTDEDCATLLEALKTRARQ